jgi:uncharacterized membrane protein YbhN (UPF0104 family)
VSDPDPREESPLGGISRKRVALVLALALVLGVGVYALIGRLADVGDLSDALASAGWPWLLACLAGLLLSYVGYVVSYRDTAAAFGGPVMPYSVVTRVVMTGFGAFTVGTTAGGLAVDFWAMHRAGLGNADAARRVLALNTLQWTSLSVATALAALLALLGAGNQLPLWLCIVWITVVPACVLAAAWVSQPSRRERLSRTSGVSRMRAAFGAAIGGVVLVRLLILEPVRYRLALVGYPIYWLGDGLCLFAGLAAFGPAPNVVDLLVAYTTGYIAVALPLPAGGAGGVDAAMVFSLTLVGIDLEQALLGVAVYRAFTFWLPVAPALAVVPTLPRLAKRLDDIAEGRAGTQVVPASA